MGGSQIVAELYRGMAFRVRHPVPVYEATPVSRNGIPCVPASRVGLRSDTCIAEWYSACPGIPCWFTKRHLYRGMAFRVSRHPVPVYEATPVSRNGIPRVPASRVGLRSDTCIAEWYSVCPGIPCWFTKRHLYRGMAFRVSWHPVPVCEATPVSRNGIPRVPASRVGLRSDTCIAEWYSACPGIPCWLTKRHLYHGMAFRVSRHPVLAYEATPVSRNGIPRVPASRVGLRSDTCIAEWYSACPGIPCWLTKRHLYHGMVFRVSRHPVLAYEATPVSRNGIPRVPASRVGLRSDTCITEWYSASWNGIPGCEATI
jgi:hypothetical protein